MANYASISHNLSCAASGLQHFIKLKRFHTLAVNKSNSGSKLLVLFRKDI